MLPSHCQSCRGIEHRNVYSPMVTIEVKWIFGRQVLVTVQYTYVLFDIRSLQVVSCSKLLHSSHCFLVAMNSIKSIRFMIFSARQHRPCSINFNSKQTNKQTQQFYKRHRCSFDYRTVEILLLISIFRHDVAQVLHVTCRVRRRMRSI
jgi:hypothetical protein